jgi:hypothetical protein
MWEVAVAPLVLQSWKAEQGLAEVDLQSRKQHKPTLRAAPRDKR